MQFNHKSVDITKQDQAFYNGLGRGTLSATTLNGIDLALTYRHEAVALSRDSEINPRAGELVELRFFGGLSESEAAEVLEVSRSTMTRDWRFARLWLYRQLSSGGQS